MYNYEEEDHWCCCVLQRKSSSIAYCLGEITDKILVQLLKNDVFHTVYPELTSRDSCEVSERALKSGG